MPASSAAVLSPKSISPKSVSPVSIAPSLPQRESIPEEPAPARPAETPPAPAVRPALDPARAAEQQADLALVRRTLAGETEAFGALVEKYKDPVYSVAYRMMGNPTEAEDVAQDAFVRAYTQLHAYSDTHRFSTWLLSITSHLAIDQIRRRRFVAMPLENVPFLDWITDGSHGPEHHALNAETSDEMQLILRKLPPKYRAVMILRYWYDLSYDEIADALKLSGALVKARLHRARVLVERALHGYGFGLGFARHSG